MNALEVVLLVCGGLVAGAVNSMAGGGSLLTVPLLVFAGVPGGVANGSNRVGVLLSNITAAAAFRRLGVSGLSRSVPVLVPVVIGSLVGAYGIAQVADDAFERAFGILMVPLLLLSLRQPRVSADGSLRAWPPAVSAAVFFGIGLYGGAFQAGVGLILLAALTRTGLDLVMANSVKVVVTLVVTATALPVFVVSGKVDWPPALVLGAGFAVGGALGARMAVRGGERVIRAVMTVAVLAASGRLVGLY